MFQLTSCVALVLVALVGTRSVAAADLVVAPGGAMRSGVPACPAGAVLAGFDASTRRLLCDTGYTTDANTWLTGEAVDGPGAARFGVFPTPGAFPASIAPAIAHGYTASPMHWCGINQVATGFNSATNQFLCSTLGGVPTTTMRRLFVTAPVRRAALPACPRGSALAGIHLTANRFLCAELPHCREDAHCPANTTCEFRAVPPRDPAVALTGPGICRPSGRILLNDRNGCFGDSAGWLTDRSGTVVDLTDSDSFDNDDARSARLERVGAGTIIRIFDRSDGRRTDDFTEILVRSTTSASYCLSTFEVADGLLADSFLTARYTDFGNLDGKVSRVEVATAIIGIGGKCLDINQNNSAAQMFTCHMGPNQSWTMLPDGTLRGLNGLCLEARPAQIGAWVAGGARTAAVQIGPCTGAGNQLWTRMPDSRLRLFSDMCMDTATGGGSDNTAIVIKPCGAAASQRWLANF